MMAVIITALLATTGLTAGASLPSTGAPAHNDRFVSTYVALGDSYAAGQGGARYRNDCKQTRAGYPSQLDEKRRIKLIKNATCAGATTTDVRTLQVAALNRGVRLVTVTAGGTDLDVVGLAAICAPDPQSVACLTALAQRQGAVAALAPSLVATYAAIAVAAPRATIIVTGYPPLVSEGPVFQGTIALNAVIQQAVRVAAAGGARIRYVDVTAVFAGHGLDSADPWFVASGPDAFHPTAAGYRAYARAIAAAL